MESSSSSAAAPWLAPVESSAEEFDGLVQELRTMNVTTDRVEIQQALLDNARYNEGDVVRAILSVYPMALEWVDDHQNTALHMAAANGHVDLVALLLRCGASPTVRNNAGNTALHWAAENGHQAVVNLLLKHNDVDVLQRNAFGRSALSAGFESENTAVVQSLLEHETASEDRLLQTSSEEPTSANNPQQEQGLIHEFVFGKAVEVKIRELPMARTDDDTILGQAQPSDDTTGLGVWAASLVTAHWVVSLRERLTGVRQILELGAGCGVPGLALAHAVPTAAVYVTDFNPQTVDNLRYNIRLNDDIRERVHGLEMNWQDPSTWPTEKMQVILGSDLIYQTDMVAVLLQTIMGLLADDGTFFYVAPVTGRQGQDAFLQGLVAAGLHQRDHVLDPAWKRNCLAHGDDDLFFVHFHELNSAEFKLYEFSKKVPSS